MVQGVLTPPPLLLVVRPLKKHFLHVCLLFALKEFKLCNIENLQFPLGNIFSFDRKMIYAIYIKSRGLTRPFQLFYER